MKFYNEEAEMFYKNICSTYNFKFTIFEDKLITIEDLEKIEKSLIEIREKELKNN